ncbi:glycosyl hydrolase family 61-domain-containing protein [Auriculariales sp. MPI-PUGE-AT-0066]|nr:glycosyl hydrolase family 61-domain-containing protein [Auriculariales sp. MPI-PUGE-AT-0066]
MKSFSASVLVALASSASLVHAHGWVSAITANGKKYDAPDPYQNPMDSPQRQITTLDPVKDLNGEELTCGYGAKSAPLTMEVTAGTEITYEWACLWGGSQFWPHEQGPVMLYAYKCEGEAQDCQPGRNAGWALIDAAGFLEGGGPFDWVQGRFKKGEGVPARVPAGMPDGTYLFRHEIISLHIADSDGPEFYPSCTQVRVVGGTKNATLESMGADLVSLPGAYKQGEDGLFKSIFDENIKSYYAMPGPKLFNPPAGQQPSETPTGTEPETGSGTTPTPTPTKTMCSPKQRLAKKTRREQRLRARALKKSRDARKA